LTSSTALLLPGVSDRINVSLQRDEVLIPLIPEHSE
jgi:hypothetical protein